MSLFAFIHRRSRIAAGMTLAAVAISVGGCRLEMYDQPKVRGYRASNFFADSQGVRPQVEGTVARESAWPTRFKPTAGFDANMRSKPGVAAIPADSSNPYALTKEFLVRGHERFNIYCSPCHGRLGDGQGMIVKRGMPTPPTYHSERLRTVKDAYIYDVITNGFGRMYGYASRISSEDRWAIIAYVRTLQFSQNAPKEYMAESTGTTSK